MRFRVASAGDGGTIEVHLDSPSGTLVGTTANITPTGGWQTYKTVSLPLTNPPAGTHELFLVFRKPGSTSSLMNMNWLEFIGKGAAVTAAPDVTASAAPASGPAPLPVKFTSTATDPDGPATDLSYAWDFGVPGTDADKSTDPKPDVHVRQRGQLPRHADRVRQAGRHDDQELHGLRSPPPPRATRRTATTSTGPPWTRAGASSARAQALTVSGGALNIATENGDVYTTSNNAKNLVLRTAPSGPWTATIKLNEVGNVQYHQAGLIVYGDDDNYTKFDREATNASGSAAAEKFEFINEVAGTPRNGSGGRKRQPALHLPGRLLHEDRVRRDADQGLLVDGRHDLDPGGPGREPARQRQDRRLRAGQRGGDARDRQVRLLPTRQRLRQRFCRGPGRRLRRHQPQQDGLELDRPRGQHQVRRQQRRADHHHGGRRHLHQQRSVRDAQLHPAVGGSHQQRLRARDQALQHAQRRVRPRRHPCLHRRRQLRQARCDLGHEHHRGQPSRAPRGDRRSHGEPAASGQRARGHGEHLAAPDQGRHELLGRVLVRRLDVDVDRRPRRQHTERREVRPLHARRQRRDRQDRELRLPQGQRVHGLLRRRRREHPAGHHLGHGDADGGLRPAAGGPRLGRDRRRR